MDYFWSAIFWLLFMLIIDHIFLLLCTCWFVFKFYLCYILCVKEKGWNSLLSASRGNRSVCIFASVSFGRYYNWDCWLKSHMNTFLFSVHGQMNFFFFHFFFFFFCNYFLFFFFFPFTFISWRLITLHYCSGFVIHWHESAMDLHVFPNLIPPPTSLSTRSLWVFLVHQPQALVSFIQPGLVICIHVSKLFSQNIPPSPSPTESKSLFCTSVSLFLFCI